MVGRTVYCDQLVLIRLNNACDVFVQLIFPFRSNEGNPVLNCKYELKIDLRIGICHGYCVPHGTWRKGLVVSDSINILSLTGHFMKKNYPLKMAGGLFGQENGCDMRIKEVNQTEFAANSSQLRAE